MNVPSQLDLCCNFTGRETGLDLGFSWFPSNCLQGKYFSNGSHDYLYLKGVTYSDKTRCFGFMAHHFTVLVTLTALSKFPISSFSQQVSMSSLCFQYKHRSRTRLTYLSSKAKPGRLSDVSATGLLTLLHFCCLVRPISTHNGCLQMLHKQACQKRRCTNAALISPLFFVSNHSRKWGTV